MESLEFKHRKAGSRDLFLAFILKRQQAIVRDDGDWDDTYELAYHKQIFDPSAIQVFVFNEIAVAYIEIHYTQTCTRISDIVLGLYGNRIDILNEIINYLIMLKQKEKKPLLVELLNDEYKTINVLLDAGFCVALVDEYCTTLHYAH